VSCTNQVYNELAMVRPTGGFEVEIRVKFSNMRI